jgi:ribonucleoside-diphosphate reductase beta chain
VLSKKGGYGNSFSKRRLLMAHASFATTTRGLDRAAFPMRLFEKAKRLGVWNPSDIDLSTDRLHWAGFSQAQKDVILHLTSLFQAGEEAVTLDLLPLMHVVASEGRIEEEMFLTTFLWEEAKHVDFFRRFLDEVATDHGNLGRFDSQNYRSIVYEALPAALQRLQTDPSPAAQIEASVTYNMIVEGVLAETGYHAYFTILESAGLLPGVRQGIRLLKQDESRHIAYGVFLLSRLVAEHPDLWPLLDERMNALLPAAVGVIGDLFAAHDPMPFDIDLDLFVAYAIDQFSKRYERLEKARGARLEDVNASASATIESME